MRWPWQAEACPTRDVATACSPPARRGQHGIRVRIGVHCGLGDIRKDPVSQGYDYYGTVVNTAARVEGVGHGGQILITEDTYNALSDGFVSRHLVAGRAKPQGDNASVTTSSGSHWGSTALLPLGPQPLRGLDEPIRLYQLVPLPLAGRFFPALRLHVEKETEDDDLTTLETGTHTGAGGATATSGSNDAATAEELISRLCGSRQYANVSPEFVFTTFTILVAAFSPTTEKYQTSVIAKLGEAWGFEKAARRMGGASSFVRRRLIISFVAKICRTMVASNKLRGLSLRFTKDAARGASPAAMRLTAGVGFSGGESSTNNTATATATAATNRRHSGLAGDADAIMSMSQNTAHSAVSHHHMSAANNGGMRGANASSSTPPVVGGGAADTAADENITYASSINHMQQSNTNPNHFGATAGRSITSPACVSRSPHRGAISESNGDESPFLVLSVNPTNRSAYSQQHGLGMGSAATAAGAVASRSRPLPPTTTASRSGAPKREAALVTPVGHIAEDVADSVDVSLR